MSTTRDTILAIAERMARKGGYAGFSFRDVASEVGIKAASVHYHFPSKEALAAEMVRRYRDRFMARLTAGAGDAETAGVRIARFVAAFRTALVEEQGMCLAGALGTVGGDLPPAVATEVRAFFDANIAWLTDAYTLAKAKDPRASAIATLATMEGALMVARNLGDVSVFDTIVRDAGRPGGQP